MYCKPPYISGIDPRINLNPQIINMASFQRMIVLYRNNVHSFTLITDMYSAEKMDQALP